LRGYSSARTRIVNQKEAIMQTFYSMRLKRLRILLVIAVFCTPIPILAADMGRANALALPSPPSFASPDFEQVWQQDDGPVASGQVVRSWLWGPTANATLTEPFAGAPAGFHLVQYFDKARMELNEAITDTNSIWRVTTGLLVTEMVQGRVQTGPDSFAATAPSDQVIAGDSQVAGNPRYRDFRELAAAKASDRTGDRVADLLPGNNILAANVPHAVTVAKFVPETSHNIADVFWNYLQQPTTGTQTGGQAIQPLFDWVYLMGYPISDPVWANVAIGGTPQPVLIQLFQRRVLTYVPSFPTGWQVQMGNAGLHYYRWRYSKGNGTSNPSQPPSDPSATPTALNPSGDNFVRVAGGNLVYNGNQVVLKGTNYWLSNEPFIQTWVSWDGPRIATELDKARQLGVNTVRIGIPYDHHDTMDIIWGNRSKMISIAPRIGYVMNQFLQIAASYNMKVIFVLFDWYDPFLLGATPNEQTNLTYLKGIVGPFVNDDRVLAWDIYNEPDFSESWTSGHQNAFIYWLRDMSRLVHSIDNRHPVTVGVGVYSDLWRPTGDGSTILSMSDFVAFHCYDAGALTNQIAAIKAHTAEPIFLEEMGWPTALGGEAPTPNAVYDEPTQSFLYNSMVNATNAAKIAGIMQWTLWDYWGSDTAFVPGHERFFGLVKNDGTFKPAANIFKDNYLAPPLPSSPYPHVALDTAAHPQKRP
jgi:hypothetical protein